MRINREQIIKDLSTEDILFLVDSLKNLTWHEDHLIRKIAIDYYGEDNTMHFSMLAVPLAIELNERFKELEKKVSDLSWRSLPEPPKGDM